MTTKIPAPIEAPIPSRIRSKGPRRRTRPSPEFIRTTSDALLSGLALSADDQNLDINDAREEEEEEEESLIFLKILYRFISYFCSPETSRSC